jgi:YbbR domain-containing protein
MKVSSLVANSGTKALALFLAFVAWFVVSAPRRERLFERAFAVPLALVGVPRDLVITTPVQDNINVRLRGRSSALRSLSSQNLEATVDLSASQPGDFILTVRPQALNVPAGIDVVSIDPTRVKFRLERLRQKIVPIRAFLVGEPSSGFTAGDPTINPAEALVSGPASQIRNVTEVATERVIMAGRSATFVQNVGLVGDSPLVRVVEPLTAQVTVPMLATSPAVGDPEKASAAPNAKATERKER